MNSRIPGTLISQGLDRARPEMTLKRKRRNEKGGGDASEWKTGRHDDAKGLTEETYNQKEIAEMSRN